MSEHTMAVRVITERIIDCMEKGERGAVGVNKRRGRGSGGKAGKNGHSG